ncbi:MAG: hypothetical protein KBF12_05155 [Sebaldella sp.]|nr:hypothetical protein [Sebaldella sp.]
MKKKRGSILLYTLIILSGLSIFLVEFIFFTKNRYKVYILKEKSIYELKERILEKEEEFSNATFENGIFYNGIKIMLSRKEDYYNSKVIETNEGLTKKLILENLIYLSKNSLSMANFKIIEIKDKNNNFYSLPLKKNTIYPELIILYEKVILNQKILLIEEISFTRKDSDEIIIENKKFQIMGE